MSNSLSAIHSLKFALLMCCAFLACWVCSEFDGNDFVPAFLLLCSVFDPCLRLLNRDQGIELICYHITGEHLISEKNIKHWLLENDLSLM